MYGRISSCFLPLTTATRGDFLKRPFSCSEEGQTWDLCFIFCTDVAIAVFGACQVLCARGKKKNYSAGENFSLCHA